MAGPRIIPLGPMQYPPHHAIALRPVPIRASKPTAPPRPRRPLRPMANQHASIAPPRASPCPKFPKNCREGPILNLSVWLRKWDPPPPPPQTQPTPPRPRPIRDIRVTYDGRRVLLPPPVRPSIFGTDDSLMVRPATQLPHTRDYYHSPGGPNSPQPITACSPKRPSQEIHRGTRASPGRKD